MEKLELQEEAVSRNILVRYFKQMPIFFPLIGLFILALTIIEFWNYGGDSDYGTIYWLRPILFLAYAIFWIFICFAKRWAAIVFLLLSMTGMAFKLFWPDTQLKHAIGDVLIDPIPINILFSFILLFYFRRLK